MQTVLKNMFQQDEPKTSYCTVTRRLSAVRYEVLNAAGRVLFAESTDFYPAGSTVVIQNGRIIGPGMRAGQHRYYEV